jgi:peptidoglycan-associated lipoprotein
MVACQSSPKDTSNQEAMESRPPVPGTAEDFKHNVSDRVFFDYDKSNINFRAEDTIVQQANWLKQYPNMAVVVEGHCDKRGTREYNIALGERRAEAVKTALISAGAMGPESFAGVGSHDDPNRPARIRTVSYGKENPPAGDGDDADSLAHNRVAITNVE